jgi:type II secretory pathway predicted ATPase ExeA
MTHLLDHAQLESIRMLTNHDMDSASPFACLLIGQPTLRRRMKLGALAALDQRIGLRYAMPRMTGEETASYLRHHLSLAGRSDTLFSDDITALIHQTSRSYPRAVNNLAPSRPRRGDIRILPGVDGGCGASRATASHRTLEGTWCR